MSAFASELWHDDLVDTSVWWPSTAGAALGEDYEGMRPAKRFRVAHYLAMLVRLLPRGRIWDFPYSSDQANPRSVWGAALGAFAAELDRLDTAIVNAMAEAVPGLASDMLTEWETELGLPEPELAETYPGLSLAQRRAAAHAKLTQHNQGLCEQFYIDLAAVLGVTITITTGGGVGVPFRAGGPSFPGVTRVGPYASPSDARSRVYSVSQLHHWTVNYPASTPQGVLDVMRAFFERLKPAHTHVDFLPT